MSDAYWNKFGNVRVVLRTCRFIDFSINELIIKITNF